MAEQQDGRVDKLVVVGASAGGIEALSALVATLPADFPAPLVIAQHISATHPSHLAQILGRQTPLSVRIVEEPGTEPLRVGVVYVVPVNRNVEITGHDVGLQVGETGHAKPSIDLSVRGSLP